MALTALEQDYISNNAKICKALMDQYTPIKEGDTFWNGTPAFSTSLTQGDIDTVPSLAGLTTTHLADAQTALNNVKTAMDNAFVALSVLANLP